MTTKDHDTDPSTPEAKQRLSEPRTAVASAVAPDEAPLTNPHLLPSTDPGVGPPAEPRPPPQRPMGIVVPPPAVPPRTTNDSVELLLEGIPGEQPLGARTPLPPDHKASAAYHPLHGLRAARPPLGDEPKVVVERPMLAQTLRKIRLQRERSSKERAASLSEGASPMNGEDVTVVSGPAMRSRLVMAVIAGLLVVVGIFVLLKVTSGARLAGATPSPPPPPAIATNPPPPAVPTADPRATAPTVPEQSPPNPATLATATASTSSAKTVALPSRPGRARPKQAFPAPPPPSAGSDVGELKTTF